MIAFCVHFVSFCCLILCDIYCYDCIVVTDISEMWISCWTWTVGQVKLVKQMFDYYMKIDYYYHIWFYAFLSFSRRPNFVYLDFIMIVLHVCNQFYLFVLLRFFISWYSISFCEISIALKMSKDWIFVSNNTFRLVTPLYFLKIMIHIHNYKEKHVFIQTLHWKVLLFLCIKKNKKIITSAHLCKEYL